MNHEIDVLIKSRDWTDVISNIEVVCEKSVEAVLNEQGIVDRTMEVAVILADNIFIQSLNRKFRGKDVPTNVLSFPSKGINVDKNHPCHLGDLVLGFGICYREFQDNDGIKEFGDHLQHLVIHGVLHLLNFDHEVEVEAVEMEKKEVAILAKLGVNSPYFV